MLNYADTGSYCNLINDPNDPFTSRGDWGILPSDRTSCDDLDGAFLGPYATQALTICKSIFKNTKEDTTGNDVQLSFLLANDVDSCVNKYSLMALLNNGKYYCVGSSGTSELQTDDLWNDTNVGCMFNP